MRDFTGTVVRGARVIERLPGARWRCQCLTCRGRFLVCSVTLKKSKSAMPLCHECRSNLLPAQGLKGALVRARKYASGALKYLLPNPQPTKGVEQGPCQECGGAVIGRRLQIYCSHRCRWRANNRRLRARRSSRAA